jgi:hypothetical protein
MSELDARAVLSEFKDVQFGDRRLVQRLGRILPQLTASPANSFPEQMKTEADQEALYRFLNNEKVTLDALLEGHRAQTKARMGQEQLVRVVHDTTDFSFEGDREGMGVLHGNRKGFFGHVSLALAADETRRPLGVLGVHIFANRHEMTEMTESQKVMHQLKTARKDKKSSRWEQRALDVSRDLPDGIEAIHIMDQEADDYSVFSALMDANLRFVIRVERSRLDAGKVRLDVQLAKNAVKLLRQVRISRRTKTQATRQHPARAERLAELNVRAGSITLQRPRTAKEAKLEKLTLQAIHVFEPSPPPNDEPIDWVLVTSERVESAAEIEAVIDHYRARWVIEEYFKSLKTGCAVEKRQLTTLDGLSRVLGLFVPMAWLLLTLRNVARDDPGHDASTVLTAEQIYLLRALLEERRRKLPEKPTVRDVMLGVAALGGHIKNNGDPGWIVLGRGFRRFYEAEEVWSLMKKRSDQS